MSRFPRPRARVFGLGLLAAVLWFYGGTSEVAWLFLIAYWCVAIAAAMAGYALWNARGLNASISLAGVVAAATSPVHDLPAGLLARGPVPAPLFEGDAAQVRLRVTSRRATRGPARAWARVGAADVEAAFARVPAPGASAEVPVQRLARGPLAARLRLETGDPLGMFGTRSLAPEREVAMVLPRFGDLPGRRGAREAEADVVATRPGAGDEVLGVREYQPGDPARRIHWRTSARRGALVVRELAPPGQRTLLLACDPTPASPAIADQVARIAASEAWDCIRAGGRAIPWAPGREALPASESGSIWPVLEWLGRYPDLPAGSGVPLRVTEVVAVTGPGGGEALAAAAEMRARGAAATGWVVGSGDEVPGDCPIEVSEVGLEWPL